MKANQIESTNRRASVIYHIETEDLWQQALLLETYIPASYENDGFIHCAALAQVTDVANKHYRGRNDLLLLCISQKLLGGKHSGTRPTAGSTTPISTALSTHLLSQRHSHSHATATVRSGCRRTCLRTRTTSPPRTHRPVAVPPFFPSISC